MSQLTGGSPRLIPNVLSIAGSDPSGGAGIQADLKTFAALGCHGMAAPTALTAQNTRGVGAVHLPPASFIAEAVAMVFADIAVAAVKVGMLGSPEIVEAVAAALAPHCGGPRASVPMVLDPVLVATSGAILGDATVIAAMRESLFPMARLITPNLAEVAQLAQADVAMTGFAMTDFAMSDIPTIRAEIEATALTLAEGRSAAWLIKGGHGEGDSADDFLLEAGVGTWLSSPRAATRNTHGTGCTLSSAIAAYLAHGLDLRAAVTQAKAYLDLALAGADALDVGRGPGPVDHFAGWRG